jgi:iron complex transport system substrate-binding protein
MKMGKYNTNRLTSLVWGIMIALAVSACGHPNSELINSAPLISHGFKDYYGRQVTLRRLPVRVVSLANSITETIYAIGAQDRLVAVSHDSDFPSDANTKPNMVTYPSFDLPTVAEFTPDLVLASTEIHDKRIASFFDRVKMNLYFENYETLEDIFESIRITGQMLGHEPQANHLADSLALLTKQITDSTAGQIKYNTVIVLGIDPIIVVGGKSFMNDLLIKAGGKNAFGATNEKYPTISPADFLKAAPEYVILPTANDKAWNDLVAMHPEIQLNTPAAQDHHVFQVEPEVIVRPGPRIVEGLAYLTRVLHSRVSVDM